MTDPVGIQFLVGEALCAICSGMIRGYEMTRTEEGVALVVGANGTVRVAHIRCVVHRPALPLAIIENYKS